MWQPLTLGHSIKVDLTVDIVIIFIVINATSVAHVCTQFFKYEMIVYQ